jgi:hypothetical protein
LFAKYVFIRAEKGKNVFIHPLKNDTQLVPDIKSGVIELNSPKDTTVFKELSTKGITQVRKWAIMI